jgi:hypothetical protein
VTELHHLSAGEQWNSLQRGTISPTELAAHYLERIARLDGELGAFLTVTADAALVRASELARPGCGGSLPRTRTSSCAKAFAPHSVPGFLRTLNLVNLMTS